MENRLNRLRTHIRTDRRCGRRRGDLEACGRQAKFGYCVGVAGRLSGVFYAGGLRHVRGGIYPGQEHVQHPDQELP